MPNRTGTEPDGKSLADNPDRGLHVVAPTEADTELQGRLVGKDGGDGGRGRKARVRHGGPPRRGDINPNKRVEVVADRFKTKLCTKWVETGHCPYDARCMFAHGEDDLRTTAMNVRDGLTTEEAVWKYKKSSGQLTGPPEPRTPESVVSSGTHGRSRRDDPVVGHPKAPPSSVTQVPPHTMTVSDPQVFQTSTPLLVHRHPAQTAMPSATPTYGSHSSPTSLGASHLPIVVQSMPTHYPFPSTNTLYNSVMGAATHYPMSLAAPPSQSATPLYGTPSTFLGQHFQPTPNVASHSATTPTMMVYPVQGSSGAVTPLAGSGTQLNAPEPFYYVVNPVSAPSYGPIVPTPSALPFTSSGHGQPMHHSLPPGATFQPKR